MGREHKNLDKMPLDELVQAMQGRRRRGRPRRGFTKAYGYTQQYWKLRQEAVSKWRAIKQVAELNRKTPEHIAACRKLVEDADPMEYLVDLYVDLQRERLYEAESSGDNGEGTAGVE